MRETRLNPYDGQYVPVNEALLYMKFCGKKMLIINN